MPDDKTRAQIDKVENDNSNDEGTIEAAPSKFQSLKEQIGKLQEKIRPYQKIIKKVQIVMYAIAVPWAIFIAFKSMPYYASIGKGESFFKQALYDDAEREFLFCYEQCKTEDPKDPRLARVLNNLSVLYRGTGRYKVALPYIKETVEIAEKHFPKRQEYPVSLSNEGAVLNELGQYAEAEKVYRHAIQVWKDNIRKDSDSKLGSIYNGLARSLREQGRLDEAEDAAKTALIMKEKESGKNSVDTTQVLENLGKIAEKKGQFEQSHKYLNQALSIDRAAFGERHPDVASDTCSIGRLYTREGKLDEANAFLAQSMQIRSAIFKPGHPAIGRTFCSIGELKIKEGKQEEAIQNLKQALKIQIKVLGSQHPDTLETANALESAESMTADARMHQKK